MDKLLVAKIDGKYNAALCKTLIKVVFSCKTSRQLQILHIDDNALLINFSQKNKDKMPIGIIVKALIGTS